MIFTIDSDDEVEVENLSDDDSNNISNGSAEINPQKETFRIKFDDGESTYSKHTDFKKQAKILTNDVTVETKILEDQIIAPDDNLRMMPRTEERALRALGKMKKGDDLAGLSGMDDDSETAFFDEVLDGQKLPAKDIMFSQLNLSRPLLRAVESLGYVNPTLVQAQVIPVALAGRDLCASAITGSGKTAAFVLPFLERLLFRPRDTAEIRVLVVTPTRELATQIFSVLQKLSQFTDITSSIICGGKKDLKSQEVTLRNRPDVIVCTPGRIIDHLRNSKSVFVDQLDVLVLDEADRLLELGFQAEIEELLRHCPTTRQTMLFSATMTAKVEDLVRLSLRRPVRIKSSGAISTVAPRLIQEFIKLRNDEEREAILVALVVKSGFNIRTIVFFETKQAAHRFCLLLSLLEVTVGELHGDMTQPMRDLSMNKFRARETEVLVATDVAARGLDVPGIRTVINAEMPRAASSYIHRVGRTARAGSGGRSITLVSDARRKVMKEVLRGEGSTLSAGGGEVLTRAIPKAVIDHYTKQIASLEQALIELGREERTKSNIDDAQREAERVENMLLHEAEIGARPARTWHQSVARKKEIQEEGKAAVKQQEEALVAESSGRSTTALASSDDYRDEDVKETKKNHRLSRKKRRRLEALKDDDDNQEDKPLMSLPKKAKINQKINQREKSAQSKESQEGFAAPKKNPSKVSNNNPLSSKNIMRPRFAVGGLDHDLSDWKGSSNSKSKDKKKKEPEKEFTEFDPNLRLRKGGKLGKNSFKSKSKFKRRK